MVPETLVPLRPVDEPHSVAPVRFEAVERNARTVVTLSRSDAVNATSTEEVFVRAAETVPLEDGGVESFTVSVAVDDVTDDDTPSIDEDVTTR